MMPQAEASPRALTQSPGMDFDGLRSMTEHGRPTRFSELFDRAAAACAAAQRISGQSAEAVARARAQRASARRLKTLAAETREAWAGADLVYSAMRSEVEQAAREMRASGMEREAAAAAVRA